MRRRFLVVPIATLLAVALAGPALAAPKGEPFEVVCDDAGTLQIVGPPGRGGWTPAFAADGTGVYITYKAAWTMYGPGLGDVYESVTVVKNTPPQHLIAARGDRCVFAFGPLAVTEEEALLYGLPGAGTWRLIAETWGLRVR